MGYTAKSDGQTLLASEYNGNLEHGYDSQAIYDADTGGDDAYVITVTPAPSGYLTGVIYSIKVTTGNTGVATLNVNSLGVKTIKKNGADDLQDGDIIAGQVIRVIYDGTNFQLLSQAGVNKTFVSGDSTNKDFLENLISGSNGINVSVNNAGGAETLRISGVDATVSTKGVLSANSAHFLITSGALSLAFPVETFSAHSIAEETNGIIKSVDCRNKMYRFEIYIALSIGAGALFIPGGANDHLISFTDNRSVTDQYANHAGVATHANYIHASGLFYTESGLADPAGADAFSNHAGLIIDASDDAASGADTDIFLYADSTTGHLKIHIGTLNGTLANAEFVLMLQELPITELGDI